jgi:hypothetical protein
MIVSEEEAQAKWCPWVRASGNGVSNNIYAQCRASKCMMWRWAQKPNPDWVPNSVVTSVWPKHPMENQMMLQDRERGYCGVAGAHGWND